MEEKVIAELFAKGYDCSQVVVSHYTVATVFRRRYADGRYVRGLHRSAYGGGA